MSDRSDEATVDREPRSTDELLAETEELLSGTDGSAAGNDVGGGAETDGPSDREAGGSGLDGLSPGSVFGSDTESEASAEPDESSRSRTGSIRSKLSPTRYFSPKAFFALVGVIGAAVLIAGSFVPVIGRMLGMFAAAFLVGLVTSKRRYLEVAAAGTSVGAVAALFDYAVFTLVGGGGTLLAIGTTAGAVACLAGYYFGRDLRDGLQRDL